MLKKHILVITKSLPMKMNAYIISAYLSMGLFTQDRRHVNPIMKNGAILIVVIVSGKTGCQNSQKN